MKNNDMLANIGDDPEDYMDEEKDMPDDGPDDNDSKSVKTEKVPKDMPGVVSNNTSEDRNITTKETNNSEKSHVLIIINNTDSQNKNTSQDSLITIQAALDIITSTLSAISTNLNTLTANPNPNSSIDVTQVKSRTKSTSENLNGIRNKTTQTEFRETDMRQQPQSQPVPQPQPQPQSQPQPQAKPQENPPSVQLNYNVFRPELSPGQIIPVTVSRPCLGLSCATLVSPIPVPPVSRIFPTPVPILPSEPGIVVRRNLRISPLDPLTAVPSMPSAAFNPALTWKNRAIINAMDNRNIPVAGGISPSPLLVSNRVGISTPFQPMMHPPIAAPGPFRIAPRISSPFNPLRMMPSVVVP